MSALSPSSPAPQQSPQESTGPEVSGPVGPATVSTSAAATPAPESNILADMQPLRIQLARCQKSLPVLGWGLQRGAINLMGSHLCSHEEGAPRSGVGVPTLQQILFQPRRLPASQKNFTNKSPLQLVGGRG